MSDLLEVAARLREQGKAFVIATVVRAEKPTSAKPGDKALITEDGVVAGWVGGSCAQPVVQREARAALADGDCRLVRLSPDVKVPRDRSGVTLRPMTCYSGGTMEIHIEPYMAPQRLLVFGNSPVAQALVSLGDAMGHHVTAVDLTDRPPLDGRTTIIHELEAIPAARPELTFAVVATHGMFDEDALQWVLKHGAAYIGLVTSRRRWEALRATLLEAGVDPAVLERIHAPAGIDIGAKLPEEVALSILAQMVELRRAGETDLAQVESSPAETAAPKEHGGSCCGGGGGEAAEPTAGSGGG